MDYTTAYNNPSCPLPQFPQPKEEWWRVKGGRAVRRPPAVFGNAYFSFWLERLSLSQVPQTSIYPLAGA